MADPKQVTPKVTLTLPNKEAKPDPKPAFTTVVEDVEPTVRVSGPKLSAKTLAEHAAGRARLEAHSPVAEQ